MVEFFVKFALALSAIIVIILVMLQKGKGGGLAGALGGAGGQSAFGTKAGDLFTKITVGVASFWIAISILTAIYSKYLGSQLNVTPAANARENPNSETPVPGKPADSGAGKTENATGKAAKDGKSTAPSSTDKAAGPSGPVGKPAEKSPDKSPSPSPPPLPTPSPPAK